MNERDSEVADLLANLVHCIRRVRRNLKVDHGPIINSKLWKAEQAVMRAREIVVLDYGDREP